MVKISFFNGETW